LDTYAGYYKKGFNLFRWGPGNVSFRLFKSLSPDANFYGLNEGIYGDRLVMSLRNKNYSIMMTLFSFDVPFNGRLDSGSKHSLTKYIDYILARYSSYVDIWELCNEADPPDNWVTFVSSYIREHDPNHHPITTNWEHPENSQIDTNSLHWYQTDLINDSDILTANKIHVAKMWNKPVIFSEVGNTQMSWDLDSARRMRIKAWTAFFNQAILIFWNDPRTLFYNDGNANIFLGDTEVNYLEILKNFISGIESDMSVFTISTNNPTIRSYAISSSQGVLAYLVNSNTDNMTTTTILFTAERDGILEWISPDTGKILQQNQVTKGNNNLPTPSFSVDLALKLVYQ